LTFAELRYYSLSERALTAHFIETICNRLETDMNIIVGLCVGHDMLFNRHSKAPVTTLIVKDRVTGHNPIAVLYGQNFYYKRLQKQPVLKDSEIQSTP